MTKNKKVPKRGATNRPGLEVARVPRKGPARTRSSATLRRSEQESPVTFGPLRAELDFTRTQFSRLLGFSERALAEWESGTRTPTEPALRSHRELERLIKALRRVMKAAYVRTWLMVPSDAFDGLKPVEVIERGEADRIWRMVYEIESGSPL